MGKIGKQNKVIVLTACINPKGMAYTALQNIEERKKQYICALNWYLENTTLPIVFVENTGYDISLDFEVFIKEKRLECLFFEGNSYPQKLGKGYGEALILEYALAHSEFLKKADYVIKITGRHIVFNINKLISCRLTVRKRINLYAMRFRFYKDKKLDSRFIFMHKDFLEHYFLPYKDKLDDSIDYTFENLLYDSCRQWIDDYHIVHMYYFPVDIIGMSGTSGERIERPTLFVLCRNFLTSLLFNSKIIKLQ